jgi:hypothetical protein
MSRNTSTRRTSYSARTGPQTVALAALLVAGGLGTAVPAHAQNAPGTRAATASTAQSPAGRPTDPIAAAITQAQASGQPVTVDTQTDVSSILVANPDGTLTRSDSSSPQRIWQNGQWAPVDTTLVRQQDGSYAPKAVATSVGFSNGGTTSLVTLKDGADALGFTWPGSLPAPTVAGDTATYPDVLPQVDLQLTANASGYSSVLVIKTPEAATNPALQQLTLDTTGTHLTVSTTSDGGAQATDTTTGATVFHSDDPLMWDSTPATPADTTRFAAAAITSGSATPQRARAEHTASGALGAHHAKVKIRFSRGRQTLTLDKALLTAKTTKYPIYVDPEWSGSPGKSQLAWARISDNGWNVYNSTATTGANNARAGWDNSSPSNGERARTYYAMNTAGIKGAVVTKADMYVNQLSAASCADTPAAVYGTAAVGSWNSSGLYWGHEPSRQTGVIDTASSHEAGQCPVTNGNGAYVSPPTLDFNVTSRIQLAAGGNWPFATLLVEAANMNDATQWKQLAYGGGATLSVTYSYRPKLKDGTGDPLIHPSVVDMGKTLTTTHTPTLSARAIDPDLAGGSETVHIQYNLYNSSGTQIATGYGPTSGYNTNGSDWTTPTLADGTYTWKATSQNSYGYWVSTTGGWTATQTFTVDTIAPHAPTIASTQFPANQIGGAFDDKGTFALGNDHTNNVMGYLFSLDGNLSNTTYAANRGTAWTTGTTLKPGTIYYASADNGTGTGTPVVNGSAGISFPPGTVGPHTLYAKAVDQAGSTSPQTSYLFYTGTSTPVFAYGDKMITGWTATNKDGTTTAVPPATTTSTGGHLTVQPNYAGYYLADGNQGMLANNTANNTKVANGDTATFSFDIPKAGPWDIGANLTTGVDYGTYTLILDAGTPNPPTLISDFNAYSASTSTHYLDFGIPKDSNHALQILSQGLHTITLILTGTDAASTGYQAGIDVLRIAPTATCPVNNTTTCLNNTAISTYTAGSTPTITTADADGYGYSLNAADLNTAGWTAGRTLTVDGAAIKLPAAFGNGTSDNMLASGQVVTLPATGVLNQGNAVVFVGFSTYGATKDIAGTITYTQGVPGSCPIASQPYTMDTVTDWAFGAPGGTVLTLPHRNRSDATQTTAITPSLFAISVPLVCPGAPIDSISLPLVSNGVQAGQSSVHFLGLGIRPTSITTSGTSTTHWAGSWAAAQDSAAVQSQPNGTTNVNATLNNQTIRIPAHLSIGTDPGNQVHIHLSNDLGSTPVTFDAASLALQDTTAGGATAAAAPLPLTFAGSTSVTLPGGTDVVSDPVTLSAPQQATALVSLKVHGSLTTLTGHLDAQTPVYVSASDSTDHTRDTAAAGYTKSAMTGIPFLAAVDVSTPTAQPTGALVLYGDQTVNSDTAPNDGLSHFSDDLATAIATDPNSDATGTVLYGILNEGSSSWNNHFLLPPVTNSTTPKNATDLADREILSQTNVRTVLISSGSSDLLGCTGTDANACATEVENKLTALASQLRTYSTDDSANVITNNPLSQLTVYVATLPPFPGTHTAVQETAREAVNAFIVGSSGQVYLGGGADGVIDFAAAVSTAGTDTSDTVKPADLSTNGTNTYPNNTYYQDLAQQYLTDTAPSTSTVIIQPN